MQSWSEQELSQVDLGDERLNKRLMKIVEDFTENPESSVPQACGNWAATKAAYEFWKNPKVKASSIIDGHVESIKQRFLGQDTILAIQDTTDLNYTAHPSTEGLGHLDHPSISGLKVHSCLAVSTQGVPQGLLYQKTWARDRKTKGKKHQRKKLPTKDKESQRWLDTQKSVEEVIPDDIRMITVADREADIYDLFALPRRENSELLIRMEYNRRVEHESKYLWSSVRQSPILGAVTVEVGRRGDQAPRESTVTVRIAQLSICAPQNRKGHKALKSIPVYLVLAEEESAPSGVEPLCWLLLVTFSVTTFEEAVMCIRYYSYRWLIERYHFVLKSGCGMEKLQLESADRLHRALATFSIVSWRLLWITYEARTNPDSPCDRILDTYEWQSLYCMTFKTSELPENVPSLKEAVLWIAKLGGFLGRKRDGEPGVKTIWRGLRKLSNIWETWEFLSENPSVLSVT